MSYNTWHTYGYGVKVSDLKCDSVERIKALLHLAPEFERTIELWLKENEIEVSSVEDYYKYDEDYDIGLAAIMKEVILETEEIDFTACDDINNETYLLYEARYPWFLKEKDRELTEESIKDILLKYFSLVTDDVVEVSYCDPENGG